MSGSLRLRHGARWFAAGVVLVGVCGCGPAPAPRQGLYTVVDGDARRAAPLPDVSQGEWTLSRERLARMRKSLPRRPYVERLRVRFVDPHTGKLYQARGAVAVSPDRAVRLVLLGPGGTTALDAWVTRDRFRVSIPPIRLQKRGKGVSDAPGLPVGFFRWWFLAPLDGALVLARSSGAESSFLLRDRAATITVRTDGERFVAIRREAGRLEGLEWAGRGLAPTTGARGRYIDGERGLRVEVVVEEVLATEPDPEAFADPDEEGAAL